MKKSDLETGLGIPVLETCMFTSEVCGERDFYTYSEPYEMRLPIVIKEPAFGVLMQSFRFRPWLNVGSFLVVSSEELPKVGDWAYVGTSKSRCFGKVTLQERRRCVAH